jgi:hypothetical protein
MARRGGASLDDIIDVSIVLHAEGMQVANQVRQQLVQLRQQMQAMTVVQGGVLRVNAQMLTSLQNIEQQLGRNTQAVRNNTAATRQNTSALQDSLQGFQGLLRQILALEAVFQGFRAFKAFIETGLEFNKTIETATIGIAALITAEAKMTDNTGQIVEGVDKFRISQVLATEQIQKLRVAGLQTTATTQELVYVFQQAVGVGLRWGLTLDQIRTLSIRMAQAASALGMPMNQLNEEIRSLLSGTINTRNTRIAVALGITNDQIRAAQKAGTLFDTINNKLEAFATAGEATAKSFSGVMSNIREAMENLAGDATKPLFDTLKVTGQQALEEVFDLKNARISDKFHGILDIAQETFGTLGDMLADAINAGMSGAQGLSDWMEQNHTELLLILQVVQDIGTEIGLIFGDVVHLGAAFGQVGVEAGVVRTILAGIGEALAVIRSIFQILLGAAALLGNIILHVVLYPIAQFNQLLGKALNLVKDGLGNAFIELSTETFDWLGNLRKGLGEYNANLANGGLALTEYANRLQKNQEIAEKAAAAQVIRNDKLRAATLKESAEQRKLDEELKAQTINQDELRKRSTALQLKLVQDQITIQQEYFKALDVNDTRERERTVSILQELRKREDAIKRGITLSALAENTDKGKDSALKRLQGQQAEIKAWLAKELAIIKDGLGQQKLAFSEYYDSVRLLNQKAMGMEVYALEQYRKTLTDKGAIDKVNSQIKALRDKQEKIVTDANAAEKKSYQDLSSDIIEINVELLKEQGHLVEAAALETNNKFRKLIAQLEQEVRVGTPGAARDLGIVERMFGITQAKTRLQELQKQSKDVTDELRLNLDKINVQVEGHDITEHQARERIADAYERARDALEAMLPAMREQARLTGNQEAINNVTELGLVIDRMNIQIRQARDEWIKFRTTARDATQGAISDLIVGLGNMPFGRQDPNIESLQESLKSSREEMEKLLKGPQTQQAQERISDLRVEIQRTTVELENSKDAISSWKDLFLDAIRSIVSALQRVAAEMLATAIIERTLKFFGGGGLVGGGGGGVQPSLSGGPLSGTHAATGGFISGPGHDTSDNIPVWLSPGEYVVRASSVRSVGRNLLDEINRQGSISLRSNPRSRGFAEGGLVTAAAGSTPGGFDATIGLEEGLVVRHMQTNEGTKAIISTIARNRKSVRSLLGPK